jgi:hypothetical protein
MHIALSIRSGERRVTAAVIAPPRIADAKTKHRLSPAVDAFDGIVVVMPIYNWNQGQSAGRWTNGAPGSMERERRSGLDGLAWRTGSSAGPEEELL